MSQVFTEVGRSSEMLEMPKIKTINNWISKYDKSRWMQQVFIEIGRPPKVLEVARYLNH
jgi:hypothetical protein